MSDINNVLLVGRLTRDVELSYTPSNNTALAKFAIAVNEFAGQGKDDYTSFIDIVVWGKMAEVCNQYIAKGSQVVVNGKLRQDRWEKDGQKYNRISVTAQSVQFVGKKSEIQNNGGQGGNNSNQGNNGEFENIEFGKTEPADIPF